MQVARTEMHLQQSTASVTVLALSADTSKVWCQEGTQTLKSIDVSLGVDSLVATTLRHTPPKPIEIEHAIELTEEHVMPLAKQFAVGESFQLQGLGAALLAPGLTVTAGATPRSFHIDDIESIFNRLVAISEGRPATQEHLPTDARFVAVVIIVREFMHHLRFANVQIEI